MRTIVMINYLHSRRKKRAKIIIEIVLMSAHKREEWVGSRKILVRWIYWQHQQVSLSLTVADMMPEEESKMNNWIWRIEWWWIGHLHLTINKVSQSIRRNQMLWQMRRWISLSISCIIRFKKSSHLS